MTEQQPRPRSELLTGYAGYTVTWATDRSIHIVRALDGGLTQAALMAVDTKSPGAALPVLTIAFDELTSVSVPREQRPPQLPAQYNLRPVEAAQPYLAFSIDSARPDITLDKVVPTVYGGLQLLKRIVQASPTERALVREDVAIRRHSNKGNVRFRQACERLGVIVQKGEDPYLIYLQTLLELHVI